MRVVDYKALYAHFKDRYGSEPRFFRAPGRVNLIGEHTDYNDGFVLPMAIDRETVVAGAQRADRLVRVHSTNLGEFAEFDLDHPGQRQRGVWLDYVEGVAQMLEARGKKLNGADLLLTSDVPVGAGLSSSAALEVSVGLALASLSDLEIDKVDLALVGQQAEHEYVGTKCGIMDQFIAALAIKGHALMIDCRTLEASNVPLDTSEVTIVICDSNLKHQLFESEYNTRLEECRRGIEILRRELSEIRALRDVSLLDLKRCEYMLPDTIRRRCRHVVTENQRTLAAADAIREGDFNRAGSLMTESHISLRDDYEVSCPELDHLVELAGKIDGVLGARMTGGGFGGSTVNLVRREALEEFKTLVPEDYTKLTGIVPAIYVSEPVEGAGEIILKDRTN